MFKDIPPCLIGDVISMLHLFDTILSTQLWFLSIGGMAYIPVAYFAISQMYKQDLIFVPQSL